MAGTEFKLIDDYFRVHGLNRDDVIVGIGDDAAVMRVPPGMDLVTAVDTLVEGVHFPADTDAEAIGYKALAVNLSDMAAMGAEPAWVTLALTLPKHDPAWLDGFSRGLFLLAEGYGVQLVGGDTTRGPLTVSVQISGLVPAGTALRRSGARFGDDIYVTGSLGDGGIGLLVKQGKLRLDAVCSEQTVRKLERPEPRVREGLALRGIANSAIDVSDGLAADLGHILTASGVGASIEVERLPVSAAFNALEHPDWRLPLSAGDDYELCFTAPVERRDQVAVRLADLGCRVTRIGTVEERPGLRCRLDDGTPFQPGNGGFDHFA